LAKDCTNPNSSERRQYGSGRGTRGGDRDNFSARRGGRDQEMSEPAGGSSGFGGGGWNNQPPSPKMPPPTWGGQADN